MGYAVIRTGGKQYRVSKGDRVRIEKIPGEVGDEVQFDDVLMVNGDDGPVLEPEALAGSKVTGLIKSHGRGKKIRVYKFKRRKGYSRTIGHRQDFTEVEISSVS